MSVIGDKNSFFLARMFFFQNLQYFQKCILQYLIVNTHFSVQNPVGQLSLFTGIKKTPDAAIGRDIGGCGASKSTAWTAPA